MLSKHELHIAGVGSSAGGLEAMLLMFAAMRPTGRVAYVVAQHMAKDGHDALVVRLIGRESALPVVLGTEGVKLLPDTVYVIPSGKDGQVHGDTLRLKEPGAGHLSTPSVNALFVSLAESMRHQAIGIVLSGTGADGALGCRAIRASGGLTLAQQPADAKFDGMPTAAIATQAIGQILPADQIGPTLATLFPGQPRADWRAPDHAPSALARALAEVSPDYADPVVVDPAYRELQSLLPQILKATGIDFSSYKEDTLLRRLEKRKDTLGVASIPAYQAYVRDHPEELHILQHLFLVSVSSFFRDRESFDTLKASLAKLVATKRPDEPVRVWVPGCASGEEALTLAIMLKELAGARAIEITATDLNPEALTLARAGSYRATAFKEMDPALRERYFSAHGQHYQANPELLVCVRYEQCDLLAVTPPDKLDLVSCRNLLIYMKSHLQDQLIKCFHQSLHAQGLLFIGQSESLSFVGNSLFVPIDHYHRLYRKRN
ncbi:MAG: chemotaxis protein [Rhodocyclaceae bacterium]|nr:chemotaxis protein [Rhodocyclaceae bacterium]